MRAGRFIPILLLGSCGLAGCACDARTPPSEHNAAPTIPSQVAAAPSIPSQVAALPPTPSASQLAVPKVLPKEVDGMLLVPGGTFTMGSDRGGEGDERPAHLVTVSPFYLDRTEVTHGAYAECVAAKVCRPPSPSVAKNYPGSQGADHPVNGVRWDDARAYCTFRNKRLPREAEFERAVRGDDGRRYPWGNAPPTPELTVFARATGPNVGQTTDPVGSHPLGRGPYGHDDLAGNLWEWMDDNYDPLAYVRPTANIGAPADCAEILKTQDKLRADGREGFTGTNPIPNECEKSIRGGAFNYPKEGIRATNRVHHPGRFQIVMLGFRCARNADP